ncbi:MAG: LptE family protein [Chitinophagaceae bacterium]|nr:LptE family protein [Chitinophagaceae bacterium]MCB9045884.1 LptE family protein [Chitinophagales bacterium]
MAYRLLSLLLPFILFATAGCGVYSFTGASIEGKTIKIITLDNKARNVVPTLSPSLTTKIRSRILSQTGLSPVSSDDADYEISGTITQYNVSVTGVENTQTASQNRLTIAVQIKFENRLNEKANFTETFTRFADFAANKTLQSEESRLITEIGEQLANDIFNKAFVNW